MNSNDSDPLAARHSASPSAYRLDHLPDDALLSNTRRLVGRSNQLLAELLAHLAEVEARGIHRERACASLYTYCIYELRLSEDAAFRRARASKIARQFPVLFEKIAAGEIHLTGVLMLGPHLTEENHLEVLARAKHRTKKEIAHLVRMLDPLPNVRAVVEPLGPALHPTAANPTWSQLVAAYAGPVRDLPPGDRPKDWTDTDAGKDDVDSVNPGAPDRTADRPDDGSAGDPIPSLSLEPQRYKVQFTATQEYVDLLQTARDLLAHVVPSRSIEEVHLRAMRALVAELKKRKAGSTRKPGKEEPKPRQRGAKSEAPRPRQRGRYVPRAVRRAVWERDGARCTYVDSGGRRCQETGGLELDHAHPHGRGGAPTAANLRLRCRAHNELTAEKDFGREFMARKKGTIPLETGFA